MQKQPGTESQASPAAWQPVTGHAFARVAKRASGFGKSRPLLASSLVSTLTTPLQRSSVFTQMTLFLTHVASRCLQRRLMSQQPRSLDRRRSCHRHRHRHRGCHHRRILRRPQDLVDRSNPIGLCASTTTGCSLLYAHDSSPQSFGRHRSWFRWPTCSPPMRTR